MTAEIDPRPFLATAVEAARLGGEVLDRHARGLGRARSESKGFRRELVTAADRDAELAVVGHLLAAFPDHAVLAEEGVLSPAGRASGDGEFLWIVDPLDGTTNFVHALPFYCVAIALAHRGEIVVGAVHAPLLRTMYTAARGHGAYRRDDDGPERPIAVSGTRELADALVATGFSYDRGAPGGDDNVDRLRRVLHAARDIRRLGSAQLDLCHTADGRFDGYWEVGLMPYDVAAGALIVREAGGRVTDLGGGEEWLYGGRILASNGSLHDALLDVVGDKDL